MAGYFVLTEPFSCGDNLRWRTPPTQREAQKASATQRPEAKQTFVHPLSSKADFDCCGNLTVAFHSPVPLWIQAKIGRTTFVGRRPQLSSGVNEIRTFPPWSFPMKPCCRLIGVIAVLSAP